MEINRAKHALNTLNLPGNSINRLIGVLLFLLAPVSVHAFQSDDGVRIDLPRDGHVNIENRFGGVSIEVWGQSFVYVSATIGGNKRAFVTSPIVIDNRNNLVSISVVRRPLDPVATIDLLVRIPESIHLEAGTIDRGIVLRGMPQSASLRSVSGEIQAKLASNAEIIAKSLTGRVKSDFDSPSKGDEHTLQLRLGQGDRVLRVSTNSGDINLTPLETTGATANATGPPQFADATTASKVAGTPATPSESEEISEGDVVRVDSQLVTLNLNVIDRNTNRGLLGLAQSDFRMFEDGVEQRVVQFDASSAPFDLVLLIDLSGSTRDVLRLIRESALRFVEAARPSDRIAVMTFAGKPTLISPLTLDRAALGERISNIQTASGDTKLYDAIDFTVDLISKERTKSRRTAIVLMSDGLDGSIPGVQGDGSKLPYNELLGRIQEFDGVLYTLWLNTEYEAMNPQDTQPEAFDAGHDRMKELADNGGGIFYEVERLEDLAGAYQRVVADLGTVYSLAYRPSNKARDKRWRAIRVTVNRPNAVARGKRGYYAN
jgi:Ca-activated chloride channel homolog